MTDQGNPHVKPWGTYVTLFLDDKVELNLLRIKAGGFCSVHDHQRKRNVFFVISGDLKVSIFEARPEHIERMQQTLVDERDPPFDVESRIKHQFEALTDVVAYELSVADHEQVIDLADIHRYTEAGFREPTEEEDRWP